MQKRYTVAARIMDLPQDPRALNTFMNGISALVMVVSSTSSEWDLKVARVSIKSINLLHTHIHTKQMKVVFKMIDSCLFVYLSVCLFV